MAHYEQPELGVSFDLPDDPSVFDIVRYDSTRLERNDEPAILILWECLRPLVQNWASEDLPDVNTPLTKVKSLKAAQVVEWAAFRGSEWRLGLDSISKNS